MPTSSDEGRPRGDLLREIRALRAENAALRARGDPGGRPGPGARRATPVDGDGGPPDLDPGRLAWSALDALGSPVALLGRSGEILAVNRAWRDFAEAGGAGGTTWEGAEYLAACEAAEGPGAADASAFAVGIRDVLAGRAASFEREYACHGPGRPRWVVGSVRAFGRGGPAGAVVVHREVTGRVLAQEARRRCEELSDQFFRHSPMGLALTSAEPPGAFERANPAFLAMTGYTEEELLGGLSWASIVDPEGSDRERELAHSLLGGEVPFYRLERRFRHRSGRPVWGRVLVTALRDGAGRPSHLIGMVEDVTERRAAEEGRRRYADRLEAILAIDQEILAARSPREIAEAALRRLVGLVPGSEGWVTLVDPATGGERLLASVGGPGSPRRRPGRARRRRPSIEVPLRDRGGTLGRLGLGWREPLACSMEHGEVVREVADVVALAIRQALLFEAVRRAKAGLESLSRRLIRAEEAERRRIARELHDETGQTLTAIRINLRAAIRSPGDPANARRLGESLELIGRAIGQIRGLSLDIRPSLLDDFGLAPALRAHAEAFGLRAGVEVRFEADPSVDRCDPEVETACYRVAQEALHNVAKHARAPWIRVELRRSGEAIHLVVADGGVGFDVAEATARCSAGKSMGMLGMKERASLIGGRLSIESGPGRGTEVRASFPAGDARRGEGGRGGGASGPPPD